ncbi:hypothetical protein KUH03_17700 [Sphingobacterium sp. E70]|uniref:hypothetical protein n=1 Tax=Sphingobacterium sp. E70 TaxID=2853439 RepID=UPI00211CFF82|nr:hypothetical protein [Sphingobacterium sp. E70]ULT28261.1 hypothetical protein KUH03_17700 [Sphingobacterium sp. E70]
MKIRIVLLLFCMSFIFNSCSKKDPLEIDLEYDVDIPNDGLKINIKDGLKEIKVEKTYLLTEGQYKGYNYAYPEIIKLNDTSLMMVAKSSVANIQDFANADLIKLLSFDKGKLGEKVIIHQPLFLGPLIHQCHLFCVLMGVNYC